MDNLSPASCRLKFASSSPVNKQDAAPSSRIEDMGIKTRIKGSNSQENLRRPSWHDGYGLPYGPKMSQTSQTTCQQAMLKSRSKRVCPAACSDTRQSPPCLGRHGFTPQDRRNFGTVTIRL